MPELRRVFFDTSSWIAAILSDRGASFYLLNADRQPQPFIITSSPDVLEEGIETVERKYPRRTDEFKELFSRVHPTLVQPLRSTLRRAATIVHPDDAPILAGAIESQSDSLVTLDKKHFLNNADDIFSHSGIVIISPGEYLRKARLFDGALRY